MATKTEYTDLTPLQLGRYAEYLVKMEFALHGFDIYGAELDDKGIDLVARREIGGEQRYYDVQVKSVRGYNYVFFPQDKFLLRDNLLAAIVIFMPLEPPKHYLIPSAAWREPNDLLKERLYEGKKSKPEWGLNLSRKNQQLLDRYRFEDQIHVL